MQNLIKTINKYIDLSVRDIDTIKQLVTVKNLNEGDFFLKSGYICNEFAFVNKGLLSHNIYRNGLDETFFFSSSGEFVSEYESFIKRKKSKKNIIALEETTLYSFTRESMDMFYKNVTNGERFGRLLIEEVFTKATNHIIARQLEDAEQRYLNFHKSFGHIQQRIPQYLIASFIGVTPQSLSRIRRQLVKK